MDYYNIKINFPSSIMLLMEDIWKLTQDLNIYNYHHIYREANRTTNCLAKKYICNVEPIIWRSKFSRDVTKFGLEGYYDSFFDRIYRYFVWQSLSIKKKEKKKKG